MPVTLSITFIGLATHVRRTAGDWPLAVLLPKTSGMSHPGHGDHVGAHGARLLWHPNNVVGAGTNWRDFDRCSLDVSVTSPDRTPPTIDPVVLDVTAYSGARVPSSAVTSNDAPQILSRVRINTRATPFYGSTGFFEIRDVGGVEPPRPGVEVATWLAWEITVPTMADLTLSLTPLVGGTAPTLPTLQPALLNGQPRIHMAVYHQPPPLLPPPPKKGKQAVPHTPTDHWHAYYPMFGNPAKRPMPWFERDGTPVTMPNVLAVGSLHGLLAETNTCMNNQGGGD